MKVLPALASLAFAACASLACAQDAKSARVALVIGNGKYADAALPNAMNDGADVAKELRAAGFTVIQRENATLKEMHLALREFGDKLTRNATGVFYFAGHGMQVRGRNYLVPVDADIQREDEVQFSAMDLAAVMEKLDSARNPVNIVILDACRNDPFGKRFKVSAQGLAQVEAPPGTLIAFATAPGSVAAEASGRNGLYTRHLLEQMRKPGAPVEETFKAVRAAVRKESQGRQIPWESTSLEASFAFHSPMPAPARVAAAAPSQAPAASPGRGIASPSAPPLFAPGDTWTYKVTNLADQTEVRRTATVREVRGAEVSWSDDQKSDLLGNFTRIKRGGGWRTYAPSAHNYVFPLNPGTRFTLAAEERVDDGRIFDLSIEFVVGGEEEVATPAGRFRAVKIDRKVSWKQRAKPSDAGVNSLTYWYSGAAKRYVISQNTNVTAAGKTIQSERWELESYKVR
jgi:hypothetical protein